MKPWERDWSATSASSEGDAGPWSRDWSGVKFDPGPKSRNLFSVANDTAIEIANAVAGNAGALANFVSPGNRFSKGVDEFVRRGEESQSDLVKADKRITRDEIEAADDWTGEVAAVGRGIIRNPLITAAQALGSFAGPGLAVKGAEAAALAAKLGPAVAGRVGLGVGAAMGGAMTGGDAAGGAYELAIQAGATEEQAQAAARQASVLPGIVGAAGGVIGAERLLLGLGKGSGNPLVQAARGAMVEGAQEGFEEGLTNFESRRAAQPFDESIDPWKGTAAAAAMGAALGGITGGAVGFVSRQAEEEAKRREAENRLAGSQSVDEMVKAANDLAMAPLDVPQMDEGRALDRPDALRAQDEKGLRQFGRGGAPVPSDVAQAADDPWQAPEATATLVDAPFGDRILTLREQLADPDVRAAIREQFGADGLNNATYYAGVADKVGPDTLPEKTRDNLLSVAEQMVRAAILKPIGTRPLTDQRPPGALALPAPSDEGGGGPRSIGLDTAPTGRFRVDAEGNAAPETRADVVSARDRERQRQAQREGLSGIAPRGAAPQTSPLVEQQRAARRRTEAQPLDGLDQADPVLSYVESLRQINTPAARAFVSEFQAGRITRRDIIEVMQSQPADPLGSFSTQGVPADNASERLRRARDEGRARRQETQAAEVQPPQPAPAPETGGVVVAPGMRARPRAVDTTPEVMESDLTTGDGMPYGTKSGASVRARREGLGPENVVEIPGSGWIIRPGLPERSAAEVQPMEAQSEPVGDMATTPAVPAAAGTGRAPDAGRGQLGLGRVADDPGRGVQGTAEAPVAGGAEAAPAGGGVGADAALSAPKFDPKGLKPGTPEYEAAFEAWSAQQSNAKEARNRQRQRGENQAAIDKRNAWRRRVRDWFVAAKDGDTIADTGTGATYKVVVKKRANGQTVKSLVAVDENGAPLTDGRGATGIGMVDGRVDGLDDASLDQDTGSTTPETAPMSLAANLGFLLESGEADTGAGDGGGADAALSSERNVMGLPIGYRPGKAQRATAGELKAGDWITDGGTFLRVRGVQQNGDGTVTLDLDGQLSRQTVIVPSNQSVTRRAIEKSDTTLRKEPPIVRYRREATEIQRALPQPAQGMTRLWRGNRPDEAGKNPQFTNDLAGIALPFRDAYKGPLSYVDVPTADLKKYEQTVGAAPGAEFIVPAEIASRAVQVGAPTTTQPTPAERVEEARGGEQAITEARQPAAESETAAAPTPAAPIDTSPGNVEAETANQPVATELAPAQPAAASASTDAQQGRPRTLPPLPVPAYRVERRYSNGAVVRPLPGKTFAPEQVTAISDWFRAAGWEVSTRAPSGVSAANYSGMTADDVPEYYTAKQRRRDEAAQAADEKASAKKAEQAAYLSTSPAGAFVTETFGDALNGSNSAALAKFLDGTEPTFGGLLNFRAADALESMGIAAEGRAVKDILDDIKRQYEATQPAPDNAAQATPQATAPTPSPAQDQEPAPPKTYPELEGKTIEQELEVEGHKVVRRRDAAKAMRALDEREASLRSLLDCLKGGG